MTYGSSESNLEHYGIKGMRWGVRNEDKTSGSGFIARNKTKNEAIAKTLTARANKTNVLISELKTENQKISAKEKTTLREKFIVLDNKQRISALTTQRDKDLKKAEATKKSKLTPTQKKVLIGAAVVGGLIALNYVAKRNLNKGAAGEMTQGLVRHDYNMSVFGQPFKQKPEFARKDLTPEEVLKTVGSGINPSYKEPGGVMNCRRCTFAYELRRRGFDVHATPSAAGLGQSETGLVNALIKGDKNKASYASLSRFAGGNAADGIRRRPIRDLRKDAAFRASVDTKSGTKGLLDLLGKQPVGSRGELVFDEGRFAHSMAYEVFKDGVHIFDTQKQQMYKGTEDGIKQIFSKWGNAGAVSLTRLDNVDLDLEFLNTWAVSR